MIEAVTLCGNWRSLRRAVVAWAREANGQDFMRVSVREDPRELVIWVGLEVGSSPDARRVCTVVMTRWTTLGEAWEALDSISTTLCEGGDPRQSYRPRGLHGILARQGARFDRMIEKTRKRMLKRKAKQWA